MAKIKITPKKKPGERDTVIVKTRNSNIQTNQMTNWWVSQDDRELCDKVIATAVYLKDSQQYRFRQAAIYSRMYGNMPLWNFAGSGLNQFNVGTNLPLDRPTMNVVLSCTDALVSRISQSRPRPVFLTDNGDYKARSLAKQMNTFINGELYQTKAYQLGPLILRDAAVLGSSALKFYETQDHKVGLDRVLTTELFVDPNESMYGFPRSLFQIKLVDRSVLREIAKSLGNDNVEAVDRAEQAYPDNSGETTKTISDQVMIIEAWHLPSGPDANDGKHVICCSHGILLSEDYKKDDFPFVFFHYSPRMLGFWGQGLAESLMGTQVEINRLLITISQSINLVGVPRVFIEDGSKVVKAQLNNNVGAMITYRGTKPVYEVAPCMPQEVYAQLQRLIEYAYQQAGINQLAAQSQKPAGLDSGAALREFDDIQSDRFAALAKRYDQIFIDAAYKIVDMAKDIAEREGKYETVFPDKNGVKQVDLPKAKALEDPFVIQCFDSSSLPRDPAGRLQKITEMMQAGLIDQQEGRRLLDYPDIEQVDKLANAGEERILKILDEIVEEGKYTAPDPFMLLPLAEKLVTQYYNLYEATNLEEKKCQMLRDFWTQLQTLKAAQTPPPMPMEGGAPQASPMPTPQNPMIPNVPGAA